MIKQIIRKLNFFIKINKLTKELKFNAPKTKKNPKMSKNGAPGMSPPVFTKGMSDIYKLILRFQCYQVT